MLITQLFDRSFQRQSSNHDYFVRTQLHTRLTEFLLLTFVRFVLPFYIPTFGVLPSQKLFCDYLVVCLVPVTLLYLSIPYACCYWFTYSMDLLLCICGMCIVYTLFLIVIYLFHAHDLCSCCFCLLFSCEMILTICILSC